jgi:hypothetical protein
MAGELRCQSADERACQPCRSGRRAFVVRTSARRQEAPGWIRLGASFALLMRLVVPLRPLRALRIGRLGAMSGGGLRFESARGPPRRR